MGSADKRMVVDVREPWERFDGIVEGEIVRINVPGDFLRATRTWRIALLVQVDEIMGLALVRKQKRSGDFDILLEVSNLRAFDPPIEMSKVESRMTTGRRDNFSSARLWNGIVPPATWASLLAQIEVLRPGASQILDQLSAVLATRNADNRPSPALAREQRDAVALGLEIAGIDSRTALPSEADTDATVPFLANLGSSTTREDAILRADAQKFADWIELDSGQYDVWRFEDPRSDQRVTVLYADKTELEKVTGTDLIYYREQTKAFVLVQYKRMSAERGVGKVGYRPDKQLNAEIARMEKLDLQDSPPKAVAEARLSAEPFYIKLVNPTVDKPDGNRLSKGMYFPLSLFLLVQAGDETKGKNGGTRITWDNADRYLTNGLFVALVQESWIGTRGSASHVLSEIIAETLSNNRGLVVVVDDSDYASAPRRRR
ncbi:hypothetical protein [Rathayibacter sp. SD072]|uniref:hypothetical protein n=1 Tax=Rathayibacter sp. SD072 TaxID=2781731 RepID=UPI001A96AAFC|nr:hypothetical protein [Rathayibacter sp. SD072]MBO0983886.1 hypothetical protein [Rathayibacter sp. SD072]